MQFCSLVYLIFLFFFTHSIPLVQIAIPIGYSVLDLSSWEWYFFHHFITCTIWYTYQSRINGESSIVDYEDDSESKRQSVMSLPWSHILIFWWCQRGRRYFKKSLSWGGAYIKGEHAYISLRIHFFWHSRNISLSLYIFEHLII